MRKTSLIALLCVLIPAVSSADVVRQGTIPKAYRGTWISSGIGPNTSLITLSAKTYVDEVNCAVVWVSITPGGRGSIYSAYLRCRLAEDWSKTTRANPIIWP